MRDASIFINRVIHNPYFYDVYVPTVSGEDEYSLETNTTDLPDLKQVKLPACKNIIRKL